MQVCRHCGWENPEIAAFCTNCGTGLGRGRATGPRFRALGLTDQIDEPAGGSVDAAWPTSAGPASPLARTLVDFPAPDLDDDARDGSAGASPLVSPPRNAAITRRTTGPVLLPDEAASSVDIRPAEVLSADIVPAPPASAPPEPEPEPEPDPEASTADLEVPDDALPVTVETPIAVVPEPTPEPDPPPVEDPEDDEVEQLNTEPHPVVAEGVPGPGDSAEEDGFDEFVDPARPDSVEEPPVDVPTGDSGEIEIASPEDSLGEAIDDFARDADVRIEPPSDSPYADDFEDELELSTSDLHTVDLSVDDGPDDLDPGSTHPAVRAVPPPLPAVSLRYVLRPFSQRDGHRELIPIGQGPVVIGRRDGDVRVTDDDYVSPRHARFGVQDSTLFVDDLDSLNGVWLRVRVDAHLRGGDEILIGQQLLRVEAAPQRSGGNGAEDGTRRLGIASNGTRFRVAQLADDGEPLDVYHLPGDGCRIGRRLGDIVFTEDTFMSGTHALLVPRDEDVLLRDLSSRNGCWVRIRGRAALDTGDAVMIGRTVWRVGRPVG